MQKGCVDADAVGVGAAGIWRSRCLDGETPGSGTLGACDLPQMWGD